MPSRQLSDATQRPRRAANSRSPLPVTEGPPGAPAQGKPQPLPSNTVRPYDRDNHRAPNPRSSSAGSPHGTTGHAEPGREASRPQDRRSPDTVATTHCAPQRHAETRPAPGICTRQKRLVAPAAARSHCCPITATAPCHARPRRLVTRPERNPGMPSASRLEVPPGTDAPSTAGTSIRGTIASDPDPTAARLRPATAPGPTPDVSAARKNPQLGDTGLPSQDDSREQPPPERPGHPHRRAQRHPFRQPGTAQRKTPPPLRPTSPCRPAPAAQPRETGPPPRSRSGRTSPAPRKPRPTPPSTTAATATACHSATPTPARTATVKRHALIHPATA